MIGNDTMLKKAILIMMPLIFISGLTSPGKVWAASYSDSPSANSLTVYFWSSDLTGNVTIQGNTAEFDADYNDVLKFVDYSFKLRYEHWKRDLGFIADIRYVNLGKKMRFTEGPVDVDVNIANYQFIMDLGVGYQFAKIPLGGNRINPYTYRPPHLGLDVMVGGRYAYFETTLDYNIDVTAPTTDENFKTTNDWFEMFIGGRARLQVSFNLGFTLQGDYGGFGIGSDHTWNFAASANYKLLYWLTISGGYRIRDIYVQQGSDEDEFRYDVQMHGPELAFKLHF
jgi:hypothetical protein